VIPQDTPVVDGEAYSPVGTPTATRDGAADNQGTVGDAGRPRVTDRPAPYYEDEFCTLIHGDCREVLPSIDPATVGLLLTDPPYGMDYKPKRGADGSKRWEEGVEGDAEPFDPSHLLAFPRLVLWGANWYADKLPTSGGWLVWDKTPKGPKEGFHASHAELAWTNLCSSVRKFSLQWGGEARDGEPHLHPTQKPLALMRWVVRSFTARGDLVFDPYMGSGPIAQVCREEKRRYIGVELREDYCATAASRLCQQALDLGGVA
jgi:site-specific DNA-methyltransferase (adenine-specific)